MAVKNILFDLGGVLLNLDVKRTRDSFIALGMANIDELFRIGHAGLFFKDYEMGAINDEEFIEAARKMTHAGTTAEQVVTAWNAMLLDFPPARVDFLNKLKKKYRLFLFSNTNAIHLAFFQESYTRAYGDRLDNHFEKAYYSHLIKYRKPDVAAFEYVIQNSGINPLETLFIDDALVNVEGARKTGLQAVHLEPGNTVLDLGLE